MIQFRKQAIAVAAFILSLCISPVRAQCTGSGPQQQQCMNNFMHHVVIPQQQAANAAAAAHEAAARQPRDPMLDFRLEALRQAKRGWGAVAMPPETHDLTLLGVAVDHGSQRSAERAALSNCAKQGGKDCEIVGVARNECIALALSPDRSRGVGIDEDMLAASGKALGDCNARSPDKVCDLLTAPVCPGIAGGSYDIDDLTDDQVARALEAVSDPRKYWGAIASNGKAVFTSEQALSESVAERETLNKCTGASCRIVSKYFNTCAVAAWRAGSAPIVSIGSAPVEMRIDALMKCAAVHGATACMVSQPSCTGRSYIGYDYKRVHDGKPYQINTRSRQVGAKVLERWLGRSEAEFRSSWGWPSDSVELYEGESRLTYSKEFTTSAGGHQGCTVSVFTRRGLVFSYATEGAACGEILR